MTRQKAPETIKAEVQQAPVQQAPSAPNIKIRSQQEIHHHLFKAQIAKMKKNISFRKGQPDIRDVEHVHFFHSVNSLAMPQQHTSEVGGHFHEVTWSVDQKGELVAECGPALKRVARRGRDGHQVTHIVPVRWENKFKNAENEPDFIVDDHRHKMTYEGSDVLSNAKISEIQKQQAKMLQQKQLMAKPEDVGLVDNDR